MAIPRWKKTWGWGFTFREGDAQILMGFKKGLQLRLPVEKKNFLIKKGEASLLNQFFKLFQLTR